MHRRPQAYGRSPGATSGGQDGRLNKAGLGLPSGDVNAWLLLALIAANDCFEYHLSSAGVAPNLQIRMVTGLNSRIS